MIQPPKKVDRPKNRWLMVDMVVGSWIYCQYELLVAVSYSSWQGVVGALRLHWGASVTTLHRCASPLFGELSMYGMVGFQDLGMVISRTSFFWGGRVANQSVPISLSVSISVYKHLSMCTMIFPADLWRKSAPKELESDRTSGAWHVG